MRLHTSRGNYTGRWLTATASDMSELPELLKFVGEEILKDGGVVKLFLIQEPPEGAQRVVPNPFRSGFEESTMKTMVNQDEPPIVHIGDGHLAEEGEIWINVCLLDRQ